jgi:hypothetical protein
LVSFVHLSGENPLEVCRQSFQNASAAALKNVNRGNADWMRIAIRSAL